MKNRLLVYASILAILTASIFFYNKYRVAKKISISSLTLTNLNGQAVKLDSIADRKLVLSFFATWCGPCVKEMPSLEAAQALLQKDGFAFFLISDEPLEQLRLFKEESGTSLQILHSERPLKQEKIFTLPTTYVLNLKKEILIGQVGIADWESPAMIEKLRRVEP
jgi:thiol-disulfide isomerase/thioredoxin